MHNFSKIFFLPDLLRDTQAFPNVVLDLIREPILQGTGISITNFSDTKNIHQVKKEFDLSTFLAIVQKKNTEYKNQDKLENKWASNYYQINQDAVDYLFQFISNDHLLLTFEAPPWLADACLQRGISFLNIGLSPLRFGRDLYIALSSSSQFISGLIKNHSVSNEELRLEASLLSANIRMHSLRMKTERNYDFEDLDNALIFIGQAPYDASLITQSGHVLAFEDFADHIHKLSINKRLMYKPHPLSGYSSHNELLTLQKITGQKIQICNQNAYQILSCEDDVELVGISSGMLQEAKWFGKHTHTLFQPFISIALDGEEDCRTYQQVHFQTFISPSFWHQILAPHRAKPRLASLPNIAHSHARETFDHWWDYSKTLTWERRLPIESFERSGGGLLRQRIEALEKLNRAWLNDEEQIISCNEIEKLLKDYGVAKREVGGISLLLNLENPHERRYAACLKMPLRYPQYDIDKMFINRFIKSGDIILDGGANIGLTALHFLEKGAKQVVAVEPIPELAERINNINDERITCIEAALSIRNGNIDIYVSQKHNQGSTYDKTIVNIFPSVFGESKKIINVRTLCIDSLSETFDIWKLDLEGAELDAIRGAREKLKNSPPRLIYAEIFDHKYEEFIQFIKEWFPYVYRAGINKINYELEILVPEIFFARINDFHETSPSYIFSKEPLQ